jgi:hypothetical protein
MTFCCFYVLSKNAISSAVVQDAVQPQFETWHEGKDIPGRGKKYSARVKALLDTDMKSVFKKESEFNAAAYCQSVIMQLKSRAVRYFADIAECFADKGAREWNRISKTGGCLLDFARDNHLVDTPRARDFSPLVSKINSNRNQKDQISCIEELRLWRMKLVDLQDMVAFLTNADITTKGTGRIGIRTNIFILCWYMYVCVHMAMLIYLNVLIVRRELEFTNPHTASNHLIKISAQKLYRGRRWPLSRRVPVRRVV